MPTRVNGIGTTYLGKRDLQVQQSVCESCHRSGPISSYETRLWFTVFFIPIIPLTRQQILNYCPRCTRHRVMPVDKWQKVQAEAISNAIAKVDANPDSPEEAIECHATLAACGKREEAAKYGDAMSSRFGNNAEVLMYLGSWFERTGQTARADQCFDRALAADPNNPAAQRAAAIGLMQQQRPRDAEKLLSAFAPPSPRFEAPLFFALAEAYQKTNDHEAALRLFKLVADSAPSAAKEKKFRKAVAKSEAALGKPGSILAPIPFYRKPAVIWSSLATAALVALVGFDRYFAQNRELFVVNGLPKPLTVRVDEGSVLQVPSLGRLLVVAPEGSHKVAVVEPKPLTREEEFTVPSSIWGRWRGNQVTIVDPSRSAVVVWEESVYAAEARDQRSDFRLHVAEPCSTFDDIDYKFVDFPQTLKVENRDKAITKHRVDVVKLAPIQLLLSAPNAVTGETRLDYLESQLAVADDRTVLLQYYWAAGAEHDKLARCRDYLKKGLEERPIDLEWHRAYQGSAEWSGQHRELVSEYDALLAKDPKNADLLYLRGRLEPYGTDSAKFLEAALQAAPDHGLACATKFYHLTSAGRFEDALPFIEKAIAGDPKQGELKDGRRHALHALGRHDQVVRELKEEPRKDNDPEWTKYPNLVDALIYQGNVKEAEETYNKLAEAIEREWPEDPLQIKLRTHLAVLLEQKNYDAIRAALPELKEPLNRASWNFTCDLNGGQLEAAAADLDATPQMGRGWTLLCVSIAARNAHDEGRAKACLTKAIALLAGGSDEQAIVADWLREPPAELATLLPKLTDLTLEPDEKAMVLVALADMDRPGKEKLLEFATKLNTWPGGRQPIVKAALARLK